MWTTLLWVIIKAVIVANVLLVAAAVLLLMERKILAYFQMRIGPNRVGPWGLFQPIADVVKMIMKEDIIPRDADNIVFRLAPMISFFTALAGFVVVPWGPSGSRFSMYMSDPNAGILVFVAIGSLSVYGIALGGWASQSKYSLLGSMRATAQMISYELAMGMAVIGVILMAGSTRISDIVAGQSGHLYNIIPQFFGFCVFVIAALAETSRTPFDLPEAEAELVGGYNTEYAGMRFGMFFLAELVHLLTMSSLISLLYLGGWNRISFLSFIPPSVAFLLKVCTMLFIFIWIRATLPRMRYDRLMDLGWKRLLPLAALNLVGTAIYVALWAS
jgi:NADH-quinone oxidoreductase subunit H